jgi:hypothetical protein
LVELHHHHQPTQNIAAFGGKKQKQNNNTEFNDDMDFFLIAFFFFFYVSVALSQHDNAVYRASICQVMFIVSIYFYSFLFRSYLSFRSPNILFTSFFFCDFFSFFQSIQVV